MRKTFQLWQVFSLAFLYTKQYEKGLMCFENFLTQNGAAVPSCLFLLLYNKKAVTQGLYIIKPQKDFIHAYGMMRYKGGEPPLMIYTLTRDDMPSLRLG